MSTIHYVVLTNGEIPVRDFIYSLNPHLQSKIMISMTLLKDFGHFLHEPHCKYLTQGIYELRVHDHITQIRLFYFFSQDAIYMTHGFIKKTSKTPSQQIKKALNLKHKVLNELKETHT